MEPMETRRENEAPRRRDVTKPLGDGVSGGESTTSRGMASASASEPASRQADRPRDHEEEIRRRAYEIYQARGGAPGSDVDDWCAAEREVRAARGERAD